MTVVNVKKRGDKIKVMCDAYTGNGHWKAIPIGKRVEIGNIEICVERGRKGKHNIKVFRKGADEPVQRGNLSEGISAVGVRAINAL